MSIEPLLRAIAELREEVDRLTDPGPPGPAEADPAPWRARPRPSDAGDDPNHRLDALARRLEGRLQRADRRAAPEPGESAR